MQAKVSKFIAAILALVIIFANSWSVVSYAAEVFLSEKWARVNAAVKRPYAKSEMLDMLEVWR